MEVHRDLVSGSGFYRSISAGRPQEQLNLFQVCKVPFKEAILGQMMPDQRGKFESYMSSLHYGLGLITAVSLPRRLIAHLNLI